jgi:hypothetical protein
MSTPNFHNVNASKIFATRCEKQFNFDDLISNIISEFYNAEPADRSESDSLRSYEGRVFAEINKTIGQWVITINLIARNGYYDGINLDWSVELENTETGDSYERGEIKIPAAAENFIDGQIAKIEKVYAEHTTPLICVGVFSNGEAVYQMAGEYKIAVPAA